ncbi:MAG: class I SAM-dependent methyltransferase [Alphaproteobacteria bacterium]
MNKICSMKEPNSQDLLDHLDTIHNRYTGFTEKIATSCCDLNGKNSYELLLDTIDPNFHNNILDLACGSGVLLEYCNKRFPLRFNLYGVDMNENELKLARTRPLNKNATFYNAKVQELQFIKDASKDVIFCHWALTLIDPVVPVLKNIKRLLKNNGVFSAIVDGDSNSAPGYSDIYNIIYKYVQKKFPNYGLLELGDSRVRSSITLNQLIEKIFINHEIKITSHILTFTNTPCILAKEVSGFFYASLVLSSEDYCVLVSKLTDYFNNISVDGLSNFNLPVNRLVVRKN